MLNTDQQRYLLTLAREAIRTALTEKRLIDVDPTDEMLTQPGGVFVTLTAGGQLRGCIGFPEAIMPLAKAVARSAVNAALQDPRFAPVSLAELDGLHLEISVLTPLVETSADEVTVGVHGLVIEKGNHRGLLLPQVPVEWGWDRAEFLAHTCRKAGLPADAWQSGAQLYTFTAEVFSEKE